MLTGTLLYGLLVLALIGLSVKERMRLNLLRERANSFPESKVSPFSSAVLNLVGYAGGIYLSLVMLFDFLKIELPVKVPIGHLQVEPLAALSIAMAIVQPFILKLFFIRRRW